MEMVNRRKGERRVIAGEVTSPKYTHEDKFSYLDALKKDFRDFIILPFKTV